MSAVRTAACLAALLLAGECWAQTYPSANVRIVVPYPAGGPTDVIARLCAQKLSEALGHQFYVEMPAKTMQEFIALARADPGKYSFAAMSLGQNLLTSERLFRLGLNLPITRVPFPGAAPILTSTVAGHTLVAFIGLPAAIPHIKEGTLRALAVTSSKRSPIVPEVPTMAESGLQDQETELNIGLVAPAATPRAVVDLLSRQLVRIVALPDMRDKLAALGFSPVGSTPEEYSALIKDDIDRWSKVVRDAGIKVE